MTSKPTVFGNLSKFSKSLQLKFSKSNNGYRLELFLVSPSPAFLSFYPFPSLLPLSLGLYLLFIHAEKSLTAGSSNSIIQLNVSENLERQR